MKIIDHPQGSSSWLWARAGLLTASKFAEIVTPEFIMRTGERPEKYIIGKVTERLLGQPLNLEQVGTFAMNNGTLLEAETIPWYEFTYGIRIQRVGFCTTDDGMVGASPDGLIGEYGGIEVKNPLPQTHLKYLLDGVVPSQYLPQVHFCLYVTGRKWWEFVSYSRQFPKLIVRIERDEAIQAKIHLAVEAFKESFTEKLARINELKARE
jgi:hypothetical protein